MTWFEHGTSRIYFEEQGSGDPVLLLPGAFGSIEELSPLREALASRFRVIAADLPGSGRSGPQPREYPATYFADDSRSFGALLEQTTSGPAHLVGFSDGGEIALLMAATNPARARSVATWGSAGALPPSQRPLAQMMGTVVDDPIEPMRGFSEYLKATYGEDNARAATQNFTKAMLAIMDSGGDISLSLAGDIKCPVMLIVGANDFMALPAFVNDLGARINDAKVVEVEGAGHAVHHEKSEWLTETVCDWLALQ